MLSKLRGYWEKKVMKTSKDNRHVALIRDRLMDATWKEHCPRDSLTINYSLLRGTDSLSLITAQRW